MKSSGEKQFLIKAIEKADKIIATSGMLIKKAEEISLMDLSKKSLVVYNGVDLKKYNTKDKYISDIPYILSIGRLTHVKGFDILLDAFKEVTEKKSSINLIIAGDGKEKNNLIDKAKKLNICGRVIFLGDVKESKVISLLNGCMLFVSSSRSEGFPNVILEAMAASKPVIAPKVGGIPEMIKHEFNGILYESGDIDTLRKNILELLMSEEKRDRLANNARLLVENNFTEEIMLGKYIGAFNSIV